MFSPTEKKVLKLLKSGKKRKTVTLVTKLYFFRCKKPYNANAVISSAILRINRKCEYYRFDWFINGNGGGRGGKTVWIDKQ